MENGETFKEFLNKGNLSQNTLTSYLWTVKYYTEHYDSFSKENLLAYKGYLLEYFKPKTVNLRIQGINKYLQFIHKDKLQLKFVKVQQKHFLKHVISNADYQFLLEYMKRAKDDQVSRFIIKFGVDSELIKEMMDLHLNEDNINEFTSLNKLKASADIDKIMAYF